MSWSSILPSSHSCIPSQQPHTDGSGPHPTQLILCCCSPQAKGRGVAPAQALQAEVKFVPLARSCLNSATAVEAQPEVSSASRVRCSQWAPPGAVPSGCCSPHPAPPQIQLKNDLLERKDVSQPDQLHHCGHSCKHRAGNKQTGAQGHCTEPPLHLNKHEAQLVGNISVGNRTAL